MRTSARSGWPTARTRCTTAPSQGSNTPSTAAGRTARERGDALLRREAGRGPPPFRRGGAGEVDERARRGVRGPAHRAAVQGRPVEPDLPPADAVARLGPAAQAVRAALALRPRGGARIPADLGPEEH